MNVTVDRITKINGGGKNLAFASVTIETEMGDIQINSISVVQGQKGLFCSLPQRKWTDKAGKTQYSNYIFLPKPLYELISDEICQEFDPHRQEEPPIDDDDIPF